MFHLLPGEIVAEIISHASNSYIYPAMATSLGQFPNDQTLKSLATLCRVCKSFYAHAARLLYTAVTVKDLNSSLIESLATNASRVRSLAILENRNKQLFKHELRPYTPEELERWRKLEDAVECMENIESVIYEVGHLSPRLSAALSKRPILRHLTAQNTIPFVPGPPPTQSLSVYWLPHEAKELASLQSLIARSAKILRELHLSLTYVNEAEVPELLETVFPEPYGIPLSRLVLDMPSFTSPIAKTLVSSIDVSGLVYLSVCGIEGSGHLFNALTGRVKSLRGLTVMGSAESFIASFSGLEELYWRWDCEQTGDGQGTIDVSAVAHHGASLRKLDLETAHICTSDEVQTLTSACQKLESLHIGIDFTELEPIAASLAGLKSLQSLSINHNMNPDVLTLPLGPYYLHPCRFGKKTALQHELTLFYPFLPYIVDGIDAALGILLVAGVSCSDISIKGKVPPYFGIFDHTLTWGRAVPRVKRWVKNGRAKDDDDDESPGAFRGGNVGDRYKCEGVEGEWEMVDSFHFSDAEIQNLVGEGPLGKNRVPFCCARRVKKCRPSQDQ
ncbi:hypothetical protein P167DRAFT_607650 [Morchella conica CCBAS932]|uniref:F-box domain-containing protein n=1 Tax=Morchella conica CCBAS932 TaxID=1392247 RepID=A0A3N4KN52_9PEZI|nr:hypothetical protein P167DRAFT_607650 [Morchella conica CCBAS932]